MKRNIPIIVIISIVVLFGCTEKTEKIIYPNGDSTTTGSIVGMVKQNDSNAIVVVRQVAPMDSSEIDPLDGAFRIDDLVVGNYDLYVKAQNYGTYWIRNIMVNAGGVTYTGEISLSDVPDLVESFYPEDETEVVFDRRWSQLSLSISFTESMDRESVEQALSIDPPAEGVFYWGTFAYTPTPSYFWEEEMLYDAASSRSVEPGAEITTYSKVKSFTYRLARKDCYTDTTYTITLSTTAKDTAGNYLEFPLTYRFSTVQSASTQNAILTEPEHGDIYVDPMDNSSIYMTFPRRMDQASVESSLTISPRSDAIYVWPSGNQVRIYTGGPLMCDTFYEIHLDENALDLDGVAMGEPFDFSFETEPVEVEGTQPQSGEIFVSRDNDISMRFNTYMVLSSVRAAFNSDPGVSGDFIRGYRYGENRPKDVITLRPHSELRPNTKYTVTIGTEAYDLHGTNLQEEYTFAFVTEPE